MTPEMLERLCKIREQGLPAVLATDLDSHDQVLHEGFGGLDPVLAERLRDDRSGVVESGGRRLFLQVFNPPLRLFVIGAGHISQKLAPMAGLAGYAVTVIDPRQAFATEERFPGVALSHEWPDDALAELKPDHRTAVVALTHDPKIDDPGLIEALRSEAFYIAALGSRKTHGMRLERLASAGFDAATLARIHGPAGLPLGATTPAEIALSVLAEMTAARHGRAGDKPTPIRQQGAAA